MTHPEGMTHHNFKRTARTITAGCWKASLRGRHPSDLKELRSNRSNANRFGAIAFREIDTADLIGGHTLERVVRGLPIEIVRRRHCEDLHTGKLRLRRRVQ